jgi:hypothetical protein
LKKERKHIDDLFREEFKDFSQEASMADFDAIMGKMEDKKKRIFPFRWFFVGVGLVALGSGIFYVSNNGVVEIATKEVIVLEDNMDAGNRDLPIKTGDKDSLRVASSANLDQKVVSEYSGKEESKIKEKQPGINESNTLAKPIKENTSLAPNTEQASLIGSSTVKQDGKKTDPSGGENKSAEPKVASNGLSGKLLSSSGIDNSSGSFNSDSSISDNENKENASGSVDSAEDKKELKPTNFFVNRVDTTPKANILLKSLPILLSKWRIELMGNYMIPGRNISSSNNYAGIRNGDEKNLAGLNIGLKVYRDIWNGLNVGTGIEMNSYNYDASYSYERQSFDLIPVLNPGGDTIGYFKSNFRDTTEKFKTTNNLKTVRIPLNVSYSINMGKQGIRIGGGIYGEKIRVINGLIPDQLDLIPVLYKTEVDEKILLGWNAEIGYYRQLSRNINLEIKTKYSASFSDLLKGNNAMDKPKLIGLGVGLSYEF